MQTSGANRPDKPRLLRGCCGRIAEFRGSYFVVMRTGCVGLGAAGEIAKVSQAFQPSGRCSAPNSL
jgi:hypothetical protein